MNAEYPEEKTFSEQMDDFAVPDDQLVNIGVPDSSVVTAVMEGIVSARAARK